MFFVIQLFPLDMFLTVLAISPYDARVADILKVVMAIMLIKYQPSNPLFLELLFITAYFYILINGTSVVQ